MSPGFARTVAVLVALLPTSCGSSNQDKYAQAAVGTGIAVAATGIHRAATKDCWGRCSPGYLCDQESGLCELGECLPRCEAGDHCVRDQRKLAYCVRDAGLPPPHPAHPAPQNPPPPLQNLPYVGGTTPE
ncbi:MAG TPA: hypothetical protein VGK73_24265 [Polyangiaceae bacterium]